MVIGRGQPTWKSSALPVASRLVMIAHLHGEFRVPNHIMAACMAPRLRMQQRGGAVGAAAVCRRSWATDFGI
jgi:hypothetical protein